MRPLLVALVATLLGLTLVPFPEVGAGASCAGPTFADEGIVLTHDGEQTVRAQGLHDGCNDTGSCSAGCDDCHEEDSERPSQNVGLRITQAGRTWLLGTVDADEDYDASWTFELPPGLQAGKARLRATGILPVVVTIR
jgi:hypothetical protein